MKHLQLHRPRGTETLAAELAAARLAIPQCWGTVPHACPTPPGLQTGLREAISRGESLRSRRLARVLRNSPREGAAWRKMVHARRAGGELVNAIVQACQLFHTSAEVV